MHPAHVEMRVGPFHPFAALPQQALSTMPSNPPPVGIHRFLGCRLALPLAPTAIVGRMQRDFCHGLLDTRLLRRLQVRLAILSAGARLGPYHRIRARVGLGLGGNLSDPD